jgi:hypothetical protein
MNGVLPLLSLYALMAWTGNTLPFYLTFSVFISVAQTTKEH